MGLWTYTNEYARAASILIDRLKEDEPEGVVRLGLITNIPTYYRKLLFGRLLPPPPDAPAAPLNRMTSLISSGRWSSWIIVPFSQCQAADHLAVVDFLCRDRI